jgi:hypothetical protein
MTASMWDQRFGGDAYVYGTEANAFLARQAERLTPGGAVLVPGDGEGRNGVWLAGQGMRVLSVDASGVGLAKARRLAAQRGVAIATEVADLLAWSWPIGGFDAVVSLFLHFPPSDRALVHARMAGALRAGGLIILEAFRPLQLAYASGGPKDPLLLFSADQLAGDFADLDILLLEEVLVDLDEGELHQGPGATVRMVARKR